MSEQMRKAENPILLFLRNVFHGRSTTSRIEGSEPITLADVSAMPEESQMLIAHFLQHGRPQLTLLTDDKDVDKLVSAGWLTSGPSGSAGTVRYTIKPSIWRGLKRLSPPVLSNTVLHELEIYRSRKSAQYPWMWQRKVG